MTEVESKFSPPLAAAVAAAANAGSPKKGRKSKAPTPIYRNSRDHESSPVASASASLSPPISPAGNTERKSPFDGLGGGGGGGLTLKKPEALLPPPPGGFPPLGPAAAGAGGPIKSYSDFMRSLAAKYNNNE